MSYIFTFPANGGGFQSIGVCERPDGKIVSNNFISRGKTREDVHRTQLIQVQYARGLRWEEHARISDGGMDEVPPDWPRNPWLVEGCVTP